MPVKLLAATLALLTLSAAPPMQRIGRNSLCVTEGAIDEAPGQRLSINVPKMRAYATRSTSQEIAADFTYLGPTAGQSKLGSGATRVQFGFKLRAADPCNLVYAMWRIEPESRLVVQVKTNPGQHTSAECSNRGYHNVKPQHETRVPALRVGDKHMFRAEMTGDLLRVFVDDGVVWEGRVGEDAMRFDGPVGIRSDNAHLELGLMANQAPRSAGDAAPCRSEPEAD